MREVKINLELSVRQSLAWEYIFDDVTDYIGYGGSAFSGKSYLLCNWLTFMSITKPGTAWGLARREITTLKKTTFRTLMKVFDECGIYADEHYKFNGQLNIVEFTNKSRIYLIDTAYKPGDPLYTRLGGYELTGCAVDQSEETDAQAIEILYSRCGRCLNAEYGIKRKVVETFNPAKNHVHFRYYKPFKEGKELSGHRFVSALPKDNPSPEVQDYIDGIMRTASKTTIERLILGNFEYDDDPNALISFDAISDVFTNSHVERTGERFISADIALEGSDLLVIGVWDGWVLIHYVTMEKSKSDEVVAVIEKLKTEYGVRNSHITYDADGVGNYVGGFVKGSKPFVNNSQALTVNGIKENYENLKAQCEYRTADLISTGGVWLAALADHHEHRRMITEEMEQVKSLPGDGKLRTVPKSKVKQMLGRSPDLWDMVKMRMIFDLDRPRAARRMLVGTA